jgi:hypothetical protein
MSESLNNMSDAFDGWVQDVRLSEKEMSALLSWIYFVTRDCCRLDIFFWTRPWNMIRLRDACDGGSLMTARISFSKEKQITWATFAVPPTRAAMANWALNKFGPVRTDLWGTLPFFAIRKKKYSSQREKVQKILIYNMYYPIIYSCCWK